MGAGNEKQVEPSEFYYINGDGKEVPIYNCYRFRMDVIGIGPDGVLHQVHKSYVKRREQPNTGTETESIGQPS